MDEPKKSGSGWLIAVAVVLLLLLIAMAASTSDGDDEVTTTPAMEKASDEIEALVREGETASQDVQLALRDSLNPELAAQRARDALASAEQVLANVQDVTEEEHMALEDAVEQLRDIVNGIEQELK